MSNELVKEQYENSLIAIESNWESTYNLLKKNWGKGEWQNEPDILGWIDEKTGYLCLIRRSDATGALCGYVGVTRNNKAYGLPMDECNFQCHWGVTFSSTMTDMTDFQAPEDFWWIGFDCGHYQDVCPAMDALLAGLIPGHGSRGVYRNVEYVKENIRELAQSIWEYNESFCQPLPMPKKVKELAK